MINERGLLEKARAFDLDALGEIYDIYSPGVYRYAMRLLGEQGLAEECVSETFSRFLQALKNGGGPQDHLQAYLYRIAHNWITDWYRRQPPQTQELDENLRDENDDPVSQTANSIDKNKVRDALFRLTVDQRQVIVLKFFEDWSNEAIAKELDKPVTAIKALQHRALGTLKRLLQNDANEEI